MRIHRCRFFSAHALHRTNPRQVVGLLQERCNQYITLACRLIPVFPEAKIRRYFEKLSREMAPGDLWCGSIALPEGEFYDRNTKDAEAIKRGRIRAIPITFGGTTFVHRPGGLEDPETLQALNLWVEQLGVKRHPGDLNEIILNTYMTQEQFVGLANSYGFKLVDVDQNPKKATASKTNYTCVLLEKE